MAENYATGGEEEMRRVSAEELEKIIEKHGRWLRGESGGERADLSGASLSDASLAGAFMREAGLYAAKR